MRDARSETREHAGELDRDIAAADDQQTLRKDRQIEYFVRCDRMFETGNFRLQHRPAASRDEDIFGANTPPVLEKPHRMGVLDDGPAFDNLGAGARHMHAVDSG